MTTAPHPGDALSAFVDGELSVDEAAEVRAHVEACAECRDELEAIRDTRLRVRMLPAVEIPAEFAAYLDSGGTVVPLRRRRRTVVTNVGAAAAAAVAAVVLIGGAGGAAPAAAIAPEPQGAVDRHDATVSATSAGLGAVEPMRQVTPSTTPPVDVLPESFVAPDELAGYRFVGAFRMRDGVHLLYEKGDHRLSLFEQHGDLGDLPSGGTRLDDGLWRWDAPPARGRVVVAERGDVVVTLVGDESAEAVLAAAEALPSTEVDEAGPSFGGRLARACGDVLEALSPAG